MYVSTLYVRVVCVCVWGGVVLCVCGMCRPCKYVCSGDLCCVYMVCVVWSMWCDSYDMTHDCVCVVCDVSDVCSA